MFSVSKYDEFPLGYIYPCMAELHVKTSLRIWVENCVLNIIWDKNTVMLTV